MYCKKCGNSIEDGALFCGNCGEQSIPDNPNHDVSDTYTHQNDPAPEQSSSCSVKNDKWHISIKILTVVAFVFSIGNLILRIKTSSNFELEYHIFSIVTSSFLLIVASLLSVILFCFIKKQKTILTIIPVWIFALGQFFTGAHPFYIASRILIIIFAIIYSVHVFLCNKRPVALPIVLSILALSIAMPFFRVQIYSVYEVIALIYSILLITFFCTYAIASFSLLPKREKKPKPANTGITSQQTAITKFCPSCGIQYTNDKKFCDQCGGELKEVATTAASNPQTAVTSQQNPMDAPSGGFAALGFFFPLIGLILYLVWKNNYPLRTRSAGKGALIGFITSVALSIILTVVYIIILKSSFPF